MEIAAGRSAWGGLGWPGAPWGSLGYSGAPKGPPPRVPSGSLREAPGKPPSILEYPRIPQFCRALRYGVPRSTPCKGPLGCPYPCGVPRGTPWYPVVPWDTLGYPGIPWGTPGYPGIPYWGPQDTSGYPGVPWGTLGYPRVGSRPMGPNAYRETCKSGTGDILNALQLTNQLSFQQACTISALSLILSLRDPAEAI